MEKVNVQNEFLDRARKEKQVTVFLTNGFQMHSTITGYDDFVVTVKNEGLDQMIYKHAISTIVIGSSDHDRHLFK